MKTLRASRKNYFFVDMDGVHGWLSAAKDMNVNSGDKLKLEIYVDVIEARHETNPDGEKVLGIDFSII